MTFQASEEDKFRLPSRRAAEFPNPAMDSAHACVYMVQCTSVVGNGP